MVCRLRRKARAQRRFAQTNETEKEKMMTQTATSHETCIQNCHECQVTCTQTLSEHCLKEGGEHTGRHYSSSQAVRSTLLPRRSQAASKSHWLSSPFPARCRSECVSKRRPAVLGRQKRRPHEGNAAPWPHTYGQRHLVSRCLRSLSTKSHRKRESYAQGLSWGLAPS